jgi:hypothetical protein
MSAQTAPELNPEALDPDVERRLLSVCETLENASGQAFAINFHNLAGDIRQALAALQSTRTQPEALGDLWQPIETAPKNGLRLDLWLHRPAGASEIVPEEESWRIPDAFWEEGHWRRQRDDGDFDIIYPRFITHWMPRPAPPAALRKAEQGGAA